MKTFLVIILILAIAYGVMILLGWIYSAPGYKGPVSDHFDGKKFHNPGNVKAKGLGDLIKWARNRNPGEWREVIENPPGDPILSRNESEDIVITFVNHSTFLIQAYGLNFLTDPVWSDRASPVSWAGPKRMRPPGVKLEELPPIDIVLLSHNHYDHLDIKALKKISSRHKPVVYTALGVGKYLKRKGIMNVIEMDWWDELPLNDSLKLVFTPAQHFSGRGMFDRDKTLWGGFAITGQDGSIYFAGDSGYGDFFSEVGERLAPVIVSLLPIGAYKPSWFMSSIHTSPEDAVVIHGEINSSLSIGTHFGTFPLADDGMDDPANDLEKALEKHGVDPSAFLVPVEGKQVRVRKEVKEEVQ